jgi:nitrite reductase/ring-hydroxylating ferredoxin subunit
MSRLTRDGRRPGRGDHHALVDIRIDTPGREGLTGTTPSSLYSPGLRDPEQVTIAPDGRPADLQPRWRQDFPIDWTQDHYVARRDFTKFMVLTSFAFAVGQFWIIGQNWWRRRTGKPEIKRIASLRELPVGGVLVFHYPRAADNCILIRLGEDTEQGANLVAYDQKCTHLACAVIPNVERGVIHCPCHEGFFDLRTGVVLAGPPPRPLPRITLEIRGDDVYATGVERRTS